jgi:hypothetical protein
VTVTWRCTLRACAESALQAVRGAPLCLTHAATPPLRRAVARAPLCAQYLAAVGCPVAPARRREALTWLLGHAVSLEYRDDGALSFAFACSQRSLAPFLARTLSAAAPHALCTCNIRTHRVSCCVCVCVLGADAPACALAAAAYATQPADGDGDGAPGAAGDALAGGACVCCAWSRAAC